MICTTVCGTWLVHTCDMTRLYVGCDSFVCATWLVHTWDVTCLSLVCVCVCVCVHATWLVHMWNGTRVCAQYVSLTRVCAQYVSFIYGMRISRTPFVRIHNSIREDTQLHSWGYTTPRDIPRYTYTRLCAQCVSFIYMMWLVHLCDMTRIYVGRDSFTGGTFEVGWDFEAAACRTLQHTASYCNTLQHAATRCNTLQHAATHLSQQHILEHTAAQCNALQRTAVGRSKSGALWHFEVARVTTHCNTLQHTATPCNTLQHTTTRIAARRSKSGAL